MASANAISAASPKQVSFYLLLIIMQFLQLLSSANVGLVHGAGAGELFQVEEEMKIDSGYLSPYFATDPDTLTVEFEKVRVLVTDQIISSVKDILPLMGIFSKSQVPLLIIAGDVTGEALSTLVVMKIRGLLRVVAIKAPGSGETRKTLLQNIATMTGAEFLASDSGFVIQNTKLEQLGTAGKITVTKDSTTIIADPAEIQ